MRKGIVMEIDEFFLTMLTPDGEFFRTRKNDGNYSLGEEIFFFPVEADEQRGKFTGLLPFLMKKRFAVAALVLLFLTATILPLFQNDRAYAYMSIDVNPSIELGVNRKMQVVEATAYNTDGKRILAKIGGWEKKDLASYTEKILLEIKKQGYLKSNRLVVISTVRTQKTEKTAESMLASNLKKITSVVKNDQLELALVEGSQKDLEKAHKLGITAGKYKEKDFHKKEQSLQFNHKSYHGNSGTVVAPSEKMEDMNKQADDASKRKTASQNIEIQTEKNKNSEIERSSNKKLPSSDRGETNKSDWKIEGKHRSEKKQNVYGASSDEKKGYGLKVHVHEKNKDYGNDGLSSGKEKKQGNENGSGKEKKQGNENGSGKEKKQGNQNGSGKEKKQGNQNGSGKEKKQGNENGSGKEKKQGNENGSGKEKKHGNENGQGKEKNRGNENDHVSEKKYGNGDQ